jgi:hypothetical protein
LIQEKVQIRNNYGQLKDYHHNYQTRPQQQQTPIIEGYFPKENTKKEMAIRKINTTLTLLLGVFILMTSVSYYFATAKEMVLNDLSRQTVIFNDENAELQNKLDKLKSFNNVDMTMQKNNILQKAQQVIEVNAVTSNTVSNKKFDTQKPFTWAIGY